MGKDPGVRVLSGRIAWSSRNSSLGAFLSQMAKWPKSFQIVQKHHVRCFTESNADLNALMKCARPNAAVTWLRKCSCCVGDAREIHHSWPVSGLAVGHTLRIFSKCHYSRLTMSTCSMKRSNPFRLLWLGQTEGSFPSKTFSYTGRVHIMLSDVVSHRG